jgi:hypothetical protein
MEFFMCNFFSCIVTKEGHVLFDPISDSHESIISKYRDRYNLIDDTSNPQEMKFARVEITPSNGDVFQPFDEWRFKIDQSITPIWFDDFCKESALKNARDFVNKSVLIGKKIENISTGRYWAKNCTFKNVTGDALIVELSGHSKIGRVCGSAKIGRVSDSAKISCVYGYAKISCVYGYASIDSVYDSASIDHVYDSASIDHVYGYASIDSVYDSAKIGSVYDSAKIGSVYDSAKIDSVSDYAKIDYVYNSAKIGSVSDYAILLSVCSDSVEYNIQDNAIAIIHTGSNPKIVVGNSNICIGVQEKKDKTNNLSS